jgi:hypothetical protein
LPPLQGGSKEETVMDKMHIYLLLGVATGIVAGFAAWSFISPMLTSVSATPTA